MHTLYATNFGWNTYYFQTIGLLAFDKCILFIYLYILLTSNSTQWNKTWHTLLRHARSWQSWQNIDYLTKISLGRKFLISSLQSWQWKYDWIKQAEKFFLVMRQQREPHNLFPQSWDLFLLFIFIQWDASRLILEKFHSLQFPLSLSISYRKITGITGSGSGCQFL